MSKDISDTKPVTRTTFADNEIVEYYGPLINFSEGVRYGDILDLKRVEIFGASPTNSELADHYIYGIRPMYTKLGNVARKLPNGRMAGEVEIDLRGYKGHRRTLTEISVANAQEAESVIGAFVTAIEEFCKKKKIDVSYPEDAYSINGKRYEAYRASIRPKKAVNTQEHAALG